jgi:phosphate-transporting ATPase
MSLLACRGLTRRPWFTDRDLELAQGEIVVLRGPTGSGKTLFLRALADLDPVDSGTVTLDGRERSTFSPRIWRHQVLYVAQAAPCLAGTVASDLARVARLDGRPEGAAASALVTAEGFGLAGDQATDLLSGGERQLLALARALSVEPRVLLLDEGTSALDRSAAERVEDLLRERCRQGLSVLWVSHEEGLVARLASREEVFA